MRVGFDGPGDDAVNEFVVNPECCAMPPLFLVVVPDDSDYAGKVVERDVPGGGYEYFGIVRESFHHHDAVLLLAGFNEFLKRRGVIYD